MEENQPEDRLKDLPLQTENVAFKPEEMIECAKCRRSNPPNRLKCFYCGGELAASRTHSRFIKPHLRKLENWEKGFNVIFLSTGEKFEQSKTTETAQLLNVEKEILQKTTAAERRVPLARAESETEAKIIQDRLRELGIETMILSDEALAIEKIPQRLRGIEFFDDKLIFNLFNVSETVEIASEDLALIVVGATFARKITATEEYNKKGDNKILEASEIASDETVIDVYRRQNSGGFRIFAAGFDFSTLGAEKELLAKDNIVKLVGKLRAVAPNAKYVDDYSSARNLFAHVWETDQRSDSKGLKRANIGKFKIENVTTVSNLSQFTKYSRLQWHLL